MLPYFGLVLLAGATLAAPAPASHYQCSSFFVTVGVDNVTTIVPPLTIPNGYAATAFADSITSRDAATPKVNLTTLTKDFNISAEYCYPLSSTATTLQILTHGLGFDRSYWDFYLPMNTSTNHSYVNAATAAGYSTLSWNRLGIEPSTIANPYTEIQALVELALLANLTGQARAGLIPQVPKPSKVIHVGHSFGSLLSNGLAAYSPALSDGIILTGYSGVSVYQSLFIASTGLHLANTNQPSRFPAQTYSNGFVTWPDVYANQYSFLAYPYFDPQVANFAELTKFPFTIGELLSEALVPTKATKFTGPVLYLAAAEDLIFCGGDCTGLYNAASATFTNFNASKNVEVYMQPHSGHGINLHYNATGAYGVMTNWAKNNGF